VNTKNSINSKEIHKDVNLIEILYFWALIAFVSGIIYLFKMLPDDKSLLSLGQLGDSFGMINWIISFLSMCGVAYTAYIMKKQLDSQKIVSDKQLEMQATLELIQYYQLKLNSLPVKTEGGYILPASAPGGLSCIVNLGGDTEKYDNERSDYLEKLSVLRKRLEHYVRF
jgi:nitrogen fixation protein